MKLFADEKNTCAWKAQIVAAYAGVKLEVVKATVESKGKLPILETAEGTLTEAHAIVRHIGRVGGKFYGSNAFEASAIDNWMEWCAYEVQLPGMAWTLPIMGVVPNLAGATQKAKSDVRKALETLNKHLQNKTFLVGERISAADVVVACGLWNLYTLVLDNGFRKQFQNTNRWFLTVVNQPNFIAVAGHTTLCDKMQVAKEVEPKEEKPKEEKKPAPKKEEKPKEEKKPAPKKEEKNDEDEDDVAAEEEREAKKKPNPLDLLPPSKFNLEDWKRFYSNEDTLTAAMPWLWEHFDAEGFSIWFAEYKYPQELEKVFMTCNLVAGFIQRMEAARKYSFASICIFGEDGNMQIGGCFIFRGKEIPQVALDECPDMESYEWRKADINSPADKQLIADYFSWSGSFGGKTLAFNQAKNLK